MWCLVAGIVGLVSLGLALVLAILTYPPRVHCDDMDDDRGPGAV